jgi:hypothetical protein
MAMADLTFGAPSPERSNAPMWRVIRQRAHQIASLRRRPTDQELDDFTRLVGQLPAPEAIPPEG